jgi:hypothetical protein
LIVSPCCGCERLSVMVAPKVGHLHLLDASEDALAVVRQNLAGATNVSFHLASVGNIPLEDNTIDFAFLAGGPASPARYGNRHPSYRNQTQSWRAVLNLPLLCARQPPMVVSRNLD